jgi:glutathione S-transferase
MLLYNVDSSPYCGRVRYFVYACNLPVEVAKQDYKDPAYRAVNPLGKVPALRLDDGTYVVVPCDCAGCALALLRACVCVWSALGWGHTRVLLESEVIIEYLADTFRPPVFRAIQPADPRARARSRLVSRLVDLYIGPHTMALYTRLPDAAQRNAVQEMHRYLDMLEALGPDPLFTKEPRPVAGDLALGLFLAHAELLGRRIQLMQWEARPRLRAFYDRLLKDPDFARIVQQNVDAFAAVRAAAKADKDKGKL